MAYTIVQKGASSINHSIFDLKTSRKNRLIAQWITVDGKLVCQWVVNS